MMKNMTSAHTAVEKENTDKKPRQQSRRCFLNKPALDVRVVTLVAGLRVRMESPFRQTTAES
jgi:hypothetical protein